MAHSAKSVMVACFHCFASANLFPDILGVVLPSVEILSLGLAQKTKFRRSKKPDNLFVHLAPFHYCPF